MARSSTTYRSKWKSGRTTVVRVPVALAPKVLQYAKTLDARESHLEEERGVYRTLANINRDEPVNVAAVPQLSPFRYPGGKTWLIPYVRTWLRSRNSRPSVLVEPFAGGGIVGLTAGIEKLVQHVVLVERDPNVASVWKAVLGGQAESLAGRIEQFTLNRRNVLSVFERQAGTQLERAFSTILRNRVQRGGIMAPGAGLMKSGENGNGLRSRWYPETLARRIRAIAAAKHCFTFIEGDGLEVIKEYADDGLAVFFIDPPYTVSARRLYDFWQIDHGELFSLARRLDGDVLMTYDNTQEILTLAEEHSFEAKPVAMKNTHHAKMTELLVGRDLSWLEQRRAWTGSQLRIAPASEVVHP